MMNAELAESIRKQVKGRVCRNCNQTILTFKSAKVFSLGKSSQADVFVKMYCKKCKLKLTTIIRNVGEH